MVVDENQNCLLVAFVDSNWDSFRGLSIKPEAQIMLRQLGNTALYRISTISFYLLTEYVLVIY